jgi:exportin-T
VYKSLVPTAFEVLALPTFNIKDGQMMVVRALFLLSFALKSHWLMQVLQEIANFLQNVCKARGQEAIDFFLGAFLPAQGWPPQTAAEFTEKLRDLDPKAFRKYFADMVRGSRAYR